MNIFCAQSQSAYVQINCGIDLAGIVAVGFINEHAYSTTPTKVNLESEGFYTNMLNNSPVNLYIATKTRGEYPGGTPTEEDGFGRESTQTTGAKHEATIEFEGVEENRNFVEGINSKKWKMVFALNGGKGIYVDTPVNAYGKLIVPRGITTGAFWQVKLSWQDFANPQTFDYPTSIFAE
jgi:hypothetical protein